MHLRCMTEYVNLSPYLITFGDGLRLYHASAMHDRIRSEKPNASFAVAWFSLTPFPCPYSKILPLTRQPHFVRSDFLVVRSEKPNASFAVAWFSLTPFPCPYSKILPLTRQPHFVRSDFLVVRSEKPNASFAVAWFLSSLQHIKRETNL